jgi:hypothetical protein
MTAWKISIWCDHPGPESDLSTALEQGELWEQATDVQYAIEEINPG